MYKGEDTFNFKSLIIIIPLLVECCSLLVLLDQNTNQHRYLVSNILKCNLLMKSSLYKVLSIVYICRV